MSEHVEGTIRFEGLIEGRFTPGGAAAEALRDWVRLAESVGVRFNLQVTGSGFSLLPDERPVPAGPIGDPPDQAVAEMIDQLLTALEGSEVFSTLRSTGYLPGKAVQALYAVGPGGRVKLERRTVEADTTAPPQPLSVRQQVRMAAFGLLIAAAAVGVTSLFVDLPALFGEFGDTIRPLDVEGIELDMRPFEPYFQVTERRTINGPRRLVLKLTRTGEYPRTQSQLDAAYDAAGESLSKRLAVEALARGYLTVRLFNERESEYLGSQQVWIGPLTESESIEAAILLPARERVGRVVLSY